MTPEQYAEHDEFTRLKMCVHREMFPHTDAILKARPGQQIRVTDAAPRFKNPAEANAAFVAEVARRWEAHKARDAQMRNVCGESVAGSTPVIGSVSEIQRLIDAAYVEGTL